MLMRNPAQWEGVRREEKTFCEENKQKRNDEQSELCDFETSRSFGNHSFKANYVTATMVL